MKRLVLIMIAGAATLGACAPMDEPMPTSPYQWERRQERITREDAERVRQCEAARTDEARRRWCREGELTQ